MESALFCYLLLRKCYSYIGFVAVVNLFCSPLLLFSASRPGAVLGGASIHTTRSMCSLLHSPRYQCTD